VPYASEEIVVPPSDAPGSIAFIATAVLPHGDPLAGANLELHIEGDGSFHPSQVLQEAVLPADMNGEVFLTWYPYPAVAGGRELKSTLSVNCDFAECLVVIQRQD
jgi:hypothetical protein